MDGSESEEIGSDEELDDDNFQEINIDEDIIQEIDEDVDEDDLVGSEEDELTSQTSACLAKVQSVINRTRSIIKICRSTSMITCFIKKKAREQGLRNKFLILDYRVRWNTTYLMIKRFITFKPVISSLYADIDRIDGLILSKAEKLKRLALTYDEWECIETIEPLLYRFYEATKLLSGRHYSTLSIGRFIQSTLLRSFEDLARNTESFEGLLANHILTYLYSYFEEKPSQTEKDIYIVTLFF